MVFKNEAYKIISCSLEVFNTLGHGLLEKPYENALKIEFSLRNIPVLQQPRFEVLYKNNKVGEYIPDLIVYNEIIVDTKTIDRITDHERGQIINYLKITGKKLGILLNFKNPKLEWERIVL